MAITSVKKRFKTPSFAAGVNREEVEQGAAALGLSLDDHMANVLAAMQERAGKESVST